MDRRQQRSPGRLFGFWGLIILTMAVTVYGYAAFRLDQWQTYFFRDTNRINHCQVTYLGRTKEIAIPHPHAQFTDSGSGRVAYDCTVPWQSEQSELTYLHLGWVFGDTIVVSAGQNEVARFQGADKPILALSGASPLSLHVEITGTINDRTGFTGLQPMVVARGTTVNSRIMGVDYALGKEANLFTILPTLTLGLVLIMGFTLGIRGRIVEPALMYFALTLLRGSLAYFADLLPGSFLNHLRWQAPLAIASGFALLILILQVLQLQRKWQRNLTRYNLLLLIGMTSHAYVHPEFYADVFQARRYLMIGLAFMILAIALLKHRRHLTDERGFLTLSLLLGTIVSLVADSYFALNHLPFRWERYTELMTPFIVGALVFVEFAKTEKSYVQSVEKISEQNKKQERLQAVVNTVHMISHDIRKPFEFLRLGLGFLDGVSSDPKKNQLTQKLSAEITIMTDLVEAMLNDLMQLDSKTPLKPKPQSLPTLIQSALKIIERTQSCGDIRLSYKLRHTKLLRVEPNKIERLLINLIDNAIDAMPYKSGNLWFHSAESGEFCQIIIGNSGSFVSDELRKKIFELFFTSEKSNGTGLGLAIAKRIVEDHGGTIRCESHPDRGTEFIFTLPTDTQWEALSESCELPENLGYRKAPPASKAEGPKIALIEDSLFVQDMWLQESTDMTIDCFDSPDAFLAARGNDSKLLTRFDAIITDYYFGSGTLTGLDLARILKHDAPNCTIWLMSNASDLPQTYFDAQISKDPKACSELLSNLARRHQRRI